MKVLELDDGYLDNFPWRCRNGSGADARNPPRFPAAGRVLYCRKLTLTAEAVDGHRIDKVRVALGE
ncbi:MAG: hypothetical protein ACLR8Y_00335 [Alistipes indistinctus]